MTRLLSRPGAAVLSLVLQACGDPAPGEGVERPHEQGAMPEVVAAQEAVGSPEIATVDLQSMAAAEYGKVVAAGPRCHFAYSLAGRPVFVAAVGEGGARGAVKIHGRLVALAAPRVRSFDALAEGGRFSAGGLRVQLKPDTDGDAQRGEGTLQRQANAILELEQGLAVGYRGWYTCRRDEASTGGG